MRYRRRTVHLAAEIYSQPSIDGRQLERPKALALAHHRRCGRHFGPGCYPSDTPSAGANSDSTETGCEIDDLAAEVLTELTSGDGRITVTSPSDRQRAQYRRAINRLMIGHRVPEGFVLRHTNRDRGDLIIRLVREAEESRQQPAREVLVPTTVSAVPSEVRTLGAEVRMGVTDASMERALRILQAIAD